MKLRPYNPTDEAALVDAWFDGWRSVGLSQPEVTRLDLAARVTDDLSSRWSVTVAEVGGWAVGFVALAVAENRLDQLFVHPNFQGQGIGAALFEVAKFEMPEGFWLRT